MQTMTNALHFVGSTSWGWIAVALFALLIVLWRSRRTVSVTNNYYAHPQNKFRKRRN